MPRLTPEELDYIRSNVYDSRDERFGISLVTCIENAQSKHKAFMIWNDNVYASGDGSLGLRLCTRKDLAVPILWRVYRISSAKDVTMVEAETEEEAIDWAQNAPWGHIDWEEEVESGFTYKAEKA